MPSPMKENYYILISLIAKLIASRIVRNFSEKKPCESGRFLLLVPFNLLFMKSICADVTGTGEMVFAVFNQTGSHQS